MGQQCVSSAGSCIAYMSCVLQMLPLPALDALANQNLEDVTGWKWNWSADVLANKHIKHVFAASTTTGLATIVGPCRELLLLGLGRPLPDLRCPDSFFDADLASAAYSAECQDAPSTRLSQVEQPRKLSSASGLARDAGEAGARATAPGLPGLLKGIESRLKGQKAMPNEPGTPQSGVDSPSEAGRSDQFRQPCCGMGPRLKDLFLNDSGRESQVGELPSMHAGSQQPSSPLRAAASAEAAHSVRVGGRIGHHSDVSTPPALGRDRAATVAVVGGSSAAPAAAPSHVAGEHIVLSAVFLLLLL